MVRSDKRGDWFSSAEICLHPSPNELREAVDYKDGHKMREVLIS